MKIRHQATTTTQGIDWRTGFIVETCHEGTDWCVRNATEKTSPDCIFASLTEAIERGIENVQESNADLGRGISPCKFWDFSE